jgi:hypothetical protein
MTAGPAAHPSCAIAHASDRTPDPMTAVMMCALAVHTVPVRRGRPSSSSRAALLPASNGTSNAPPFAAFAMCTISLFLSLSD